MATISRFSQFVNPSNLQAGVGSGIMDFKSLSIPPVEKSQLLLPQCMPSPASSIFSNLDMDGEPQRLQPSHNYSQYRQQTGIPTQVDHMAMLAATTRLSSNTQFSSSFQPDYSLSQFNYSSIPMWDTIMEDESYQQQLPAQPPPRVFPGMHQKMASEQLRLRQQQLQLEANQEAAAAASRLVEQQTQNTVQRVVHELRAAEEMNANNHSLLSPNATSVTQLRSKKDIEDMDEDERLLNSEEGKKLSSKERRQLRNKVSARAFRHRRKDYISLMESQLQDKDAEIEKLRALNQELVEKNLALKEKMATCACRNSNNISLALTPATSSVDLSGLNLGNADNNNNSTNNWAMSPLSTTIPSQFLNPHIYSVHGIDIQVHEPTEAIDSPSEKFPKKFFSTFFDKNGQEEEEEDVKSTFASINSPLRSHASFCSESITATEQMDEDLVNADEEHDNEAMSLYAPSAICTSHHPLANESKVVTVEQDASSYESMLKKLDSRSRSIERLMNSL